jgi:hypothetical protein
VTSDTIIPAQKFTREFPPNSFSVLRLKTDKP